MPLAATLFNAHGTSNLPCPAKKLAAAHAHLLPTVHRILSAQFGRLDCVLSLEIVERVFAPRQYAATLDHLCKDGGLAIVSTPYHGYWKNLALAATGKFDAYFTALWDFGHIKFWSVETPGVLLRQAGFRDLAFHRVGRLPALATSMIAVARR